jgi:hypothetical protein
MDFEAVLSASYKIVLILLPIIFSAIVGYVFGAAKAFRDAKLKAYEETLPPIVKVAFEPSRLDQPEFNKALIKLWLFASRKVALKMDRALSILADRDRGDAIMALQEAIAEMRGDIQFLRRQKVEPKEVSHFYTTIGGKAEVLGDNTSVTDTASSHD